MIFTNLHHRGLSINSSILVPVFVPTVSSSSMSPSSFDSAKWAFTVLPHIWKPRSRYKLTSLSLSSMFSLGVKSGHQCYSKVASLRWSCLRYVIGVIWSKKILNKELNRPTGRFVDYRAKVAVNRPHFKTGRKLHYWVYHIIESSIPKYLCFRGQQQ